jgi:hypothetical protein
MVSPIKGRAIALLGLLAGCGAGGPLAAQAPAAPAKQAVSPPSESPALAQFRAAARKMGVMYAAPPGYAEVAVHDNTDQSYDYAVASAEKRIEMRFALRPYGDMPEPLRNLHMSFIFFMTGISNLVRGGDDGKFNEAQDLPAAHFNADDARIIAVRWFSPDTGANAFGNGYEACSAIFMHRDRVGDAYTFVLLKDRAAIEEMDEETLHTMRFADR